MSELIERLAIVEGKAQAAHSRMDNFEKNARDDLTEIKADIKEIVKDVREVIAWKNRSLGWAAAAVFITSVLSGTVAFSVAKMIVHTASAIEKVETKSKLTKPNPDDE